MPRTNTAELDPTKSKQLIAGALYRNKDGTGPFWMAADTPPDIIVKAKRMLTSGGDSIKIAKPGMDLDSLEFQYMCNSLASFEVKRPDGGAGAPTAFSAPKAGPWLQLPTSVLSDSAIESHSKLRRLELERDSLRELNLKLAQELQVRKREIADIKAEKFINSVAAGSSAIKAIDELLAHLESSTNIPQDALKGILGSIKVALVSYEPTSQKAAANLKAIDELNAMNTALSLQLKEMESRLAAKELLEQHSKVESAQTKK
ncbi:MAG: hypothetical protein K0Q57_1134, partial [Gammaproteobacteria bacterium]|nr:hypothetical protein [Gammaproteobacteria bacterium]